MSLHHVNKSPQCFSKAVLYTILALLGTVPFGHAVATPENPCPSPTLHPDLSLTIPCAGVAGQQYSARLSLRGETPLPSWQIDAVEETAECAWSPSNCATFGLDGSLMIPGVGGLEARYDARLAPDGEGWRYAGHYQPSEFPGFIASHGNLTPLPTTEADDGQGKKLLAIYMVGGDLESGPSAAATRDLKELRDGYEALQAEGKADAVEVVVAFGGSDKDGWRGVKFARMQDIVADLADDGEMGSLEHYPYQAPLAHMGDASTFRLFLDFVLSHTYVNYSQRFLVLWDHGASYGGVGFDQYYRHDPLSLAEVEQALDTSGARFDVIGFDACFMASVETANYLHAYADYLVASEELEPGHGWDWSDVLRVYAYGGDDVATMSAQLVHGYVERHPRSRGKTLSVADLSEFPLLKKAVDAWLSELRSQAAAGGQGKLVYSALRHAMDKAQVYGGGLSVDLQNLVMEVTTYLRNPAITDKAKAVYAELAQYVEHTVEDGSRPGSYGVSVNLPVNAPNPISLGAEVDAIQRMWHEAQAGDTRPPTILDEQQVTVVNWDPLEAQISSAVDLSLEMFLMNEPLCAEAIEILQDLGYDPAEVAPEAFEYLHKVRSILESDTGFDEKMLELSQVARCPTCSDMTPYLSDYIEVPRGVFPRDFDLPPPPPSGTGLCGRDTRRLRTAESRTPPFLRGERAAFVQRQARNLRSTSADAGGIKGTVATFNDDSPLRVTTVYGYLDQNNEFRTVAELEAYPTQEPGRYFTPDWNGKWYQLSYAADAPATWLPMVFQRRYREQGRTFTRYTVEMEYLDADVSYPEPGVNSQGAQQAKQAAEFCAAFGMNSLRVPRAENFDQYRCIHRARLELVMDENNTLASHKIVVLFRQVQADGTEFILPDKLSRELEDGDRLRFLYQVTDRTGATVWKPAGDGLLRLTQAPEFHLAILPSDMGPPPGVEAPIELSYRYRVYRMRAVGAATGPSVFSAARPIEVMPDCATMQNGLENFDLAWRFVKPENALIALEIMKRMAEAIGPSYFGIRVAEFESILLPARTGGTWDISKIDWPQARQQGGMLEPLLEKIFKQQCER